MAAAPPPRPPMGQAPMGPPMGQIVSQDRPHERPAGARRPGTRASTTSYARTLAPLVGMSIVVVVLIAGITAWISSAQERTASPPVPRPAAVPSSSAPPSAVAPTTKVKAPTPKPKPKAVVPKTTVPKATVAPKPTVEPKASATKPPVASAKPDPADADTPDGNGEQAQTCTGLFCPQN